MFKKTLMHADGGTAHTTAPLSEAVARASQNRDAEFCDSATAKLIFGLGRSLLYELAARGLIKSVSLRKPGSIKGKRLWVVASIRAYLNAAMEGGVK